MSFAKFAVLLVIALCFVLLAVQWYVKYQANKKKREEAERRAKWVPPEELPVEPQNFFKPESDDQFGIYQEWKKNADVFNSVHFNKYLHEFPEGTVESFLAWFEETTGKPFRQPEPGPLTRGDYLGIIDKVLDRYLLNGLVSQAAGRNVDPYVNDLRQYWRHVLLARFNELNEQEIKRLNAVHLAEEQYLDVIREILQVAEQTGVTPDRTGTGRVRLFGRDIRVDVSDGTLPVITTRKINIEHGFHELKWMMSGSTNLKDLDPAAHVIWKDWAVREQDIEAFINKFMPDMEDDVKTQTKNMLLQQHEGSIGPMYGKAWRDNPAFSSSIFYPFDDLLMEDIPSDRVQKYGEMFDEENFFHRASGGEEVQDIEGVREKYIKSKYFESGDQLGEIIRGIKRRPYSARHVLSAWIPQHVPFEGVYTPHENIIVGRGALTVCHVLSQFFVEKATDGGPDHISLRVYQRSADWALGVCTNLVFYGLFLHLVAHVTGKRPKELIWSGGDCHLYSNHLEEAKIQIERTPFAPPKIKIRESLTDIFQLTREDVEIVDYKHHEFIRYKHSV